MSPPTLYILYNADASVMGKLAYGYRKLTTKDKNKPACAACDITHGGLHLDETSQWKAAKAGVVESGAVKEVKQMHRDELDAEVCVVFPCIPPRGERIRVPRIRESSSRG